MWMAALQLLGKANQDAAAARINAAQSKTAASIAKMEASKTALSLQMNFNKRMGADAVVAASQNRRGGSVDAIANAAAEALDWDLGFAKLSGDINYSNRMAESSSYSTAGQVAQGAGFLSAGVSLFSDYQKSKQIGGRTTEKQIV